MSLKILNSDEFIVFSTRDYAQAHDLSFNTASQRLSRWAKQELLTKVTRGIWANTQHAFFSPIQAVPYLLKQEIGYVSFLTALHRHGLISQIPATIQVATTGRPRKINTEIGEFEFFQLKPQLMQEGIKASNTKVCYMLASLEKALLDTLYLSTRKGKRFSSLPELHFEDAEFCDKKFQELLENAKLDQKIKSAIHKGLLRYRSQ